VPLSSPLPPFFFTLTALLLGMLHALCFAPDPLPAALLPWLQLLIFSGLMGFLAYVVGMNVMLLGTDWITAGKIPQALGMWWLTAPLLTFGAWLYFGDGRLRRGWRLFMRN